MTGVSSGDVGTLSVGLVADGSKLPGDIQKAMTHAATRGATAAKAAVANTGQQMSAKIAMQIAQGSISKSLQQATDSGAKAAEARARLAGMVASQNMARELGNSRVADAMRDQAKAGDTAAEGAVKNGGFRASMAAALSFGKAKAVSTARDTGTAAGNATKDAMTNRIGDGKISKAIVDQVEKGKAGATKSSKETGDAIGNNLSRGLKTGGSAFKSMIGVISANSGGALGPLQEIYEKTDGLGEAFEKSSGRAKKALVGIGAAVTGVGAVLGTIVSNDTANQAQLQSAIEATGVTYDSMKDKVKEATEHGLNMGYSVPASEDALNRLVVGTGSAEKGIDALSRAMDFAAMKHISLQQAATLLSQAYNGTTGTSRTLRQFGIDVTDSSQKQKEANTVWKDATKATEAQKKAQQALNDTEARTKAALSHHKASADDVLKAQVALQAAQSSLTKLEEKGHGVTAKTTATHRGLAAAQQALTKATYEYGAGSAQAQAAQARIAAASGPGRTRKAPAVASAADLQIAHERVTIAQRNLGKVTDESTHKTKMSTAQAIALRNAHQKVGEAALRRANDEKKLGGLKTQIKDTPPIYEQVNSQIDKKMKDQAKDSIDSWTGHLQVMGLKVETKIADVSAPYFKKLVMIGPAMMGVGAVLETGVFGALGRGTKAVGSFGAALAKVPFKGLSALPKAFDGVRLRAMYMKDAWGSVTTKMGTSWIGLTNRLGDARAWVSLRAQQVATQVTTAATAAATKIAEGAQASWAGVKRFFITTTDLETGATKKSILATMAQAAWTKIAGAATKVWTGIQAAFNLVMDANPIVLVGLAIAALVGGIIIAYNKVGWFRDMVKGAWKGIQTGADFMWKNVLKPTFKAIEGAAEFLWKKAIKPTADGIGKAFTAVSNFGHSMWTTLKGAFSAVVSAFLDVAGSIVHTAAHAFGWVPGISGQLKGASKAFDTFKDSVNTSLNNITDKTINVTAAAIIKSPGNGSATGGGQTGFAAGGVEDHVAQIAPGRGPVRVWGEPETGGEAYIPLSPGKRSRSKALLRHVADRFGMQAFADGGVTIGAHVPPTSHLTHNLSAQFANALALTHLMPAIAGITSVLGQQTSAASTGVNLFAQNVGQAPARRSGIVKMAQAMAEAFAGWGHGSEWSSMYKQIEYESGWNPTAQNPTSTAYGLGQFLNSTWAGAGIQKTSDPATQITGYLRYVKGRYGDPNASWAFEQRKNYYADGGLTGIGGLANGGLLPAGPTIAINLANGMVTRLNERGTEAVVPAEHAHGFKTRVNKGSKPKPHRAAGFDNNAYISADDIRAAALGAAPNSQLQGTVNTTKAAVAPLQAQYNAIKKVDDADHKRVTTITDQIKKVRESEKAFNLMSAAQQAAYVAAHKGQPGVQAQLLALTKQEDAAKKAAKAQDQLLTPATKKLTAAQTAAKDAAKALHDALVSQAAEMANAVRSSATQDTSIGSIFNYNPGYGANSASRAESVLRNRVKQFHTFAGLLHRLAQKGLDKGMLQELIAAGPQAGIAIANNILNDPKAVTTLNSLEKDLQSAITSTSTDLISRTLGVGNPGSGDGSTGTGSPRPKNPPRSGGNPHPPKRGKVKPGTVAHKIAADASVEGYASNPALVVQGDFVVNSASDVTRLSQLLQSQKSKTNRARGGTRR